MKTIILYGLRRSGNHFFISTILQQFKNSVHLNDVFLSYTEYCRYKMIDKTKERNDHEYIGFKDTECVIISLENKMIDEAELDKFIEVDDCHIFILLRSPYCHFSSVWSVYNKNEEKLLEMIKLWKIYAERFIHDSISTKVLYDEFTVNEHYRKRILNSIEIKDLDIKLDHYITYQVSSFTNKDNQKQVYKNINECIYKDDKRFIELVKDDEIVKLWDSIKDKDAFS
tara:strand:- start:7091 stop:7771 length:681 start_codon:yes stop_codon:yes gene_type:complete